MRARSAPSARRSLAVGVVALLLLGGAAACSSDGSDGASPTSTTEAPTTTSAPAGSTSTTAAAGPSKDDTTDVPLAEVDGPITGGTRGIHYNPLPEGLADEHGYTDEEFFLSGDATSYAVQGELGSDGEWTVAPSETAPYTTRMIVRRPVEAADFNGTVLVEWLNVSAGRDSDPDFGYLAAELLSQGYAYVGISAQRGGIEPGGLGIPVPGVDPAALAPLKTWDPERYGSLVHPGDEYSYDIFSQAARTALHTGDGTPLGDLDVTHLIALGESQSAARMVSYANAIQPVTDLFDGFFVHSRGGGAPDVDAAKTPIPGDVHIRADLDVPVFQFQTETDLFFPLDWLPARQPDTDRLVTWEVAGTAHVDQDGLDFGVASGRRWTDAEVDLGTTCGRINEGTQGLVARAALRHLQAWVVDGTVPPSAEPLGLDATGTAIARDDLGIARGGLRTPSVDAPTSILSGESTSDEIICILFGTTTAMTPEQLAARYPDHDAYVAAVTESAEAANDAGHLLEPDAAALINQAATADIP